MCFVSSWALDVQVMNETCGSGVQCVCYWCADGMRDKWEW
jgi:hypothetical protein